MNNDITTQYLDKLYDDLHKEQMRLLSDLKSGTQDHMKESDIQKQISQMNTMLITTLRFRNLRKKIHQEI